MSTLGSPVSLPPVTIDPEVMPFLVQRSLQGLLTHMLGATLKLIPQTQSIRVSLIKDYEIPDSCFVVWKVAIPEEDLRDHLELERRWVNEFLRATPRPIEQSFVLNLVSPNS